jgi:hypothetical protein
VCGVCKVDQDCRQGGRQGVPFCDTETGQCVMCTGANGCAADRPICVAFVCRSCKDDRPGCAAKNPSLPLCRDDGWCVECLDTTASSECKTAGKPICANGANTCMACSDDAGCKAKNASFPACDKAPGSGACVECLEDAQCTTAARPICDKAKKACVPCASDDECVAKGGAAATPGICLTHQGGRCATEAETVYVRNSGGCVTAPAPGGTSATPFCLPQDAINAASNGKDVVLILGPDFVDHVTAAPASGQLTIIGRGATIVPGIYPGLRVSGGDVYVRGLTVMGSTQPGLVAENGAVLRVDRCTLTGNKGGILINNAGFEIANTIIANNLGAPIPGSPNAYFGGIYLKAAAGKPSSLRNCTIVDNKITGLACADAYAVKGLLAFNNEVDQIVGCTHTASSVGIEPKFDPGRPFHLTANSPCVNTGDPSDFPAADFDGEARPQRGLSDCGADELK